MDSIDQLERLPGVPESRPGLIRRGWNAVKNFFAMLGRTINNAFWGILFATAWSWREFHYWFRLFLYTSRRFLRIEFYIAFAGAFIFFGWVIGENRADNMRDLLYYCYLYFSVVMVLLCMNLLPRERDDDTLEILWSQPIRRGSLIFIQLLTVSIWVLLLSVFAVFFFSYFSSYPEGRGHILLFLFTTSFTVGAITVLVSTFCRHGIATGLVSLLILGVHFFWLRPLGPVELFFNPIPYPGYSGRPIGLFPVIFNRVVTLIVAGFVLDYLLRRLRQTARWFT